MNATATRIFAPSWRRKIIPFGALILLAALINLVPSDAFAVPAAPIVHTLTQASGETFRARQWGDENLHGWETENGYTILFNDSTQSWHFAVPGLRGELIDSTIPVEPLPTPFGTKPENEVEPSILAPGLPRDLKPHLRPVKPINKFMERIPLLNILDEPSAASSGNPASATTGTMNIPVILVNFSDTTTTNVPVEFDSLLFGTGTTDFSLKQYYEEVSYGQFSVSAGANGIVGWYTASKTHDYYGANLSPYGDDQHPAALVYEALQAADPLLDFSIYALNLDCTLVSPLMVVHQGDGEEVKGNAPTNIWSHKWKLSYAAYYDATVPGVFVSNDPCPYGGNIKVDTYTIQPERYRGGMTTMGVFAHELGHGLGLPDLYDYGYDSEGVGRWSLMASGSWNGVSRSGDRPGHPDPRAKFFLGWVTPEIVTTPLSNRVIQPANCTGDIYQMGVGNPVNVNGEYFLAENRQRAGFDAGLPASGLLIWHIDEAMPNNDSQCYPGGPSCAFEHYKVALVQADNLWQLEQYVNKGDMGDPFPGSLNNTSFSATTAPSSNWYSGAASNVRVACIRRNADATMSAMLSMVSGTARVLTVCKNGDGEGTVASNPSGIQCGAVCSAQFSNATVLSLTSSVDSGNVFTGWTGACSGTNPSCTVILNQSLDVVANFAKLTPTPTPTPISEPSAELGGSWLKVRQACRGGEAKRRCTHTDTLRVTNMGQATAVKIRVRVFLSSDAQIDSGDRQIYRFTVAKLKPGKALRKKFTVKLPKGFSPSGLLLTAWVDADYRVQEKDELNNVVIYGPLP